VTARPADNQFAALDLGSNSFHLLIARRTAGGFETVERLKEKVQLLAGFRDGRLHPDAVARGEACLARFAQRLAALPRANVRMVGTHALRRTADPSAFAARAEALLGVPLEVISGAAEARLVFLGVARHVSAVRGRPRLVIDIGGGSTELAWSDAGDALRPARVASFDVGCVALRDLCFAGTGDVREAFAAARTRALEVLDGLTPADAGPPPAGARGERPAESGPAPALEVIGTSGTVESVQGVLAANGWGGEVISREGLAALTDAVGSGRWLVDAGLPGLAPERVDIFPAGLAVVDALFERLSLATLHFVDVSLQDGLLYRDLDAETADPQTATVAALKHRFAVDAAQADRVRHTVLTLFDAVGTDWWRQPGRWRELLGWAAELHEIGHAVAARHYHRHGAYLLQNADLRAFSDVQQRQLALLLRGHRRSFPGMAVRAWDADTRHDLIRLLALLRLAVILHRSHGEEDLSGLRASAAGARLAVALPPGWLAAHPLSARELEVERAQLDAAGIRLEIR